MRVRSMDPIPGWGRSPGGGNWKIPPSQPRESCSGQLGSHEVPCAPGNSAPKDSSWLTRPMRGPGLRLREPAGEAAAARAGCSPPPGVSPETSAGALAGPASRLEAVGWCNPDRAPWRSDRRP